MTLHTPAGPSWPARFAYAAALMFTLASGGTNLIYGWSKGTDTASSLVWAGVSVGVSIVFALSWPALIRCCDTKQWPRAVIVAIALLITGTYSVSAALGSAMGGRTNAESAETTATNDRKRSQADYDKTEKELAKLPATRSVEEVQVLINAARPVCRVHITTGARKTVCTKPPALETELARAKQRDKLKAAMDKASSELKGAGAPKVANSDAAALAVYLNGLGFAVTEDRLNKLLVLLAVLVVECGGGLALAVGMSLSDKGAGAQPVQTGTTHSATPPTTKGPNNWGQITPAHTVHSAAQSTRDRLLELVRDANGVLRTGHRGLGDALGVSATRAGQLLRGLVADESIRVRSSKTGSVITLTPRSVAAPRPPI
jgi:hypothetical protein